MITKEMIINTSRSYVENWTNKIMQLISSWAPQDVVPESSGGE